MKPTKLDPFKGYMLRRIDAAKPYWIPATVIKLKIGDPVVRFKTLPGKQMQVDFTNISRGGNRMKGFVATLGFSRSRRLAQWYRRSVLPLRWSPKRSVV